MNKWALRIVTDYYVYDGEGYENNGYWEENIYFNDETGLISELKRLGYILPDGFYVISDVDCFEIWIDNTLLAYAIEYY